MPRFTLIDPAGHAATFEGADGDSVMQTAVSQGAAGIVGECGGSAMCATCHVYVRPGAEELLPPIGEDEDEMLDCTAAPRQDASRLSCQLLVSDAVPDLVVQVPAEQV